MTVRLEVHDHVALLTLDRPEVRNALTVALLDELARLVTDCDRRHDVRAMVLTGADPAFCSGMDLRAFATDTGPAAERARATDGRFRAFPEHATPIIGAINGPAVTGGLELALGCDFLIASERARFADTHGRVGVMPGMGMTVRLPALIGIDRARRMSLTGDFIDARVAYEWGLVTEVVAHDELVPRAMALASTIASVPTAHVEALRAQYDDVQSHVGDAAWDAETRRSQAWMRERFDRARLATERAGIIERGRSGGSSPERPGRPGPR
jgi:enoyl-CoA hydratase